MSYDYVTQRHNVFTEDGQKMFLRIRDNAKELIARAGAVTAGKMMNGCSGDSWHMLACIDRLVGTWRTSRGSEHGQPCRSISDFHLVRRVALHTT